MDVEQSALIEVHVSVPDAETARLIARDLVEGEVAACVQCLGPMATVYAWEDGVEHTGEWLLLIKTTTARFSDVCDVVTRLHPYEVPEILAVPITDALTAYVGWVREHSVGQPVDPA